MKDLNKFVAAIVSLLALYHILCYILLLSGITDHNIADIAPEWLLNLLLIALLLLTGSIVKSHYILFMVTFTAVFATGILFLAMHWIAADIILLIGSISGSITYSIRFFNKQSKNTTDLLKLLWIYYSFIGTLLVIFHIINPPLSVYITKLSLLLSLYFGIHYFLHPFQPSTIQTN